jgi:rhodanese-related sulfurtransferase
MIAPADLNRMIVDLPGSFDLVDIRPPDKFADYHIPSSHNVPILDLVEDPKYLQGTTPLVIVDRDGYLAMAVGGIVVNKTQRPVRVLHGGLEAYWRELTLYGAAPPGHTEPSQQPAQPAPPGESK